MSQTPTEIDGSKITHGVERITTSNRPSAPDEMDCAIAPLFKRGLIEPEKRGLKIKCGVYVTIGK